MRAGLPPLRLPRHGGATGVVRRKNSLPRRHQRSRVRDTGESSIPDNGGERFGIDLAQLARTHLNRTPVAPALRHRVSEEVLARGGHSVAQIAGLQALGVRGADYPRQHSILAIGLLDPPPAGIAGDVKHGGKREPRANCPHLRANHPGNLLDESRVPCRCKPDPLGKDRRITVTKATCGLLVEDDRDAEPGALNRKLLDGVHERCTLVWVQASRGANARDLPNSMRHFFSNDSRVEGSLTHESSTPEAPKLG